MDNNEITDECEIPDLPNLETLCMNNNNIKNIKNLLDKLRHSTPNLKYLSLLKNPCCPNRLIGKEDDDYKRYRLYVLWRMPNLSFLDSGKVTAAEKAEANRRGEFCLPQQPVEVCFLKFVYISLFDSLPLSHFLNYSFYYSIYTFNNTIS